MKNFKDCAAQGDIFIFRVDSLPADIVPAKVEDGKFIVAHSETGHHHTVPAQGGVEFFLTANPNVTFMKVEQPVELRHERGWDTHETLKFPKGIFQINRQQELAPEGWRQVQD